MLKLTSIFIILLFSYSLSAEDKNPLSSRIKVVKGVSKPNWKKSFFKALKKTNSEKEAENKIEISEPPKKERVLRKKIRKKQTIKIHNPNIVQRTIKKTEPEKKKIAIPKLKPEMKKETKPEKVRVEKPAENEPGREKTDHVDEKRRRDEKLETMKKNRRKRRF